MQRRWEGRSVPDVGTELPSISRGFTWEFRGRTQRLRVRIPMWLHVYYLSRPRSTDHRVYAVDPFHSRIIDAVAASIDRYARQNALSEAETIEFATTFVHHLEYVPDDVSTPYDDYPRYPIETLVHRGGDCEDTSILLAAILQALGYAVGLLSIPEHLQVGVVRDSSFPGTYYEHNQRRYYVLEATGGGWRLGEMPPEYEGVDGEVLPLSNVPVLFHQWSATATARRGVAGTVYVTNLGSGAAPQALAVFKFETETGETTGTRMWTLDGIAAGETRTLDLDARPSDSGRLYGRVQLFVGSDLHDESGCWSPN